MRSGSVRETQERRKGVWCLMSGRAGMRRGMQWKRLEAIERLSEQEVEMGWMCKKRSEAKQNGGLACLNNIK